MMDRVIAFGSSCGSSKVHLTTTQTSSLPTSIQTISSTCTMSSTIAASSGTSSITSQALPVSVPHPPATTSQAGTAVDYVPQHPLQPMLKSIMEELRRTCNEVKKLQENECNSSTNECCIFCNRD